MKTRFGALDFGPVNGAITIRAFRPRNIWLFTGDRLAQLTSIRIAKDEMLFGPLPANYFRPKIDLENFLDLFEDIGFLRFFQPYIEPHISTLAGNGALALSLPTIEPGQRVSIWYEGDISRAFMLGDAIAD
jgi:hypothetical protein